jgi:hypothetical protein
MEVKSEEKAKAAVLGLAILLMLVLLFTRMSARLKENQNNPTAASQKTAAPNSTFVAARSTAGVAANPFWTDYAIDSIRKAAAQAHAGVNTGTNGQKAGGGGTQPASVVPPVTADLSLLGIVTDGTSMAIVKVGEDTRYLKVGGSIDPLTRVVAIEPGKVTLSEGVKLRELLLGQTLVRAAAPQVRRNAEIESVPLPATLPGFAEPQTLTAEQKVNAGF